MNLLQICRGVSVNSVPLRDLCVESAEQTGAREPRARTAYSDPLRTLFAHRNFYCRLGIFARDDNFPPFTFSGLALVRNVRQETASGEGKSRIPSGIEGWAGFLPPAIPAGSFFTYPSRTPGGGVSAFFSLCASVSPPPRCRSDRQDTFTVPRVCLIFGHDFFPVKLSVT